LVKIINDNTAATGTVPLYIQQDAAQSGIFLDMNGSGYGLAVDMDGNGNGINVDNAGTGDGIKIDQNGNGIALNIDTEATSATGLNFSNPAQTTGNVILLDSANNLTTGRLAFLGSNSSDTSTRNLVEIVNEHASATGATSLRIRNDSTGTNIQVDGSGFALSGSYQSTGSFGRGGLKVGLEGPPQLQGNINGAGIDIAASTFPQLFFHNSTSGYGNEDGTRLTYEGHTLFFQGFEAAANFKFLTNNNISTKNIHLIFGCRTKEDLLYFDELKELEKINPNFNYHIALSRVDEEGFHNGYVHDIYLPLIKDLKDKPLFYLCGWRNMILDAKDNLSELGYKMVKDIKIEVYN